jgi:hypothetical protein
MYLLSSSFSDQLSMKLGGEGQGQICLPRPSVTALMSVLRQQLDYLVDSERFLIASKIGELLGRKVSGGKARGRVPDSGASIKAEGFFVKNLVKLVNLVPGR